MAFTFNCLFFGALAFRQISDNMNIREYHFGEDRWLLADPRAALFVGGAGVLAFVLAALFVQIEKPAVFHYAFPLIIASQALQMALRIFFQRTRIKTNAILVRAVLSDRFHLAPYKNVIAIVVHDERLWVSISLLLPTEEVTFRIFRNNRNSLIKILQSSCTVPVMFAEQKRSNNSTEHTV